MKKIVGFLGVLIILAAIAFGIYSILPETQHNYFYSMYQMKFDSEAKAKILEVQSWQNPNLNADYKTILESHTKTRAWVYKKDVATGADVVTYYGSNMGMVLKEIPDHEDMILDNANVKVEFIKNSNGEIVVNVYLAGEKTPVDDATKPFVFEQLLNGTPND